VMATLHFLEHHGLMSDAQLRDTKRSIQALFIQTATEETLLEKLVDMVQVTHDLRQGFGQITTISARIATSLQLLDRKFRYMQQYFDRITFTPEETYDFVDPFQKFATRFRMLAVRFGDDMERYLDLRETQARRSHEYKIAERASNRLRDRLAGALRTDGMDEAEENLRDEAIGTFNFAQTEQRYVDACEECKAMSREIITVLHDMRSMCQMAMNHDMRDQTSEERAHDLGFEDIFRVFTMSHKNHPRLRHLQDFCIDYFKLYQKAYGMLQLDYENFEKAVESILASPDEYFDAKEGDEDTRLRLDKLAKYRGLIPFLEAAQAHVDEHRGDRFQDWSRRFSALIVEEYADWDHVSEQLLVAKVAAEADLTTQLRA